MWFLALVPFAQAQPVVLSREVAAIAEQVEHLDANSCGPVLHGIYQGLRAVDPSVVDADDVGANGSTIARSMFDARLTVQGRLAAFHEQEALSEACVSGARRFDLVSRYTIDHLVLAGVNVPDFFGTDALQSLDEVQAGDLLVTRGDALSSAGIAHIGEIDSHFSHNAIVHVDAQGRAWTVEAYIERGALVQPLEDFLAHGLARVVVARYAEPEQAARGAALAFERVVRGAHIPYDEDFDHRDDTELFCSEVGPWALRLAGGPTDVPLHQTRFTHDTSPALLGALGVEAEQFAAPADVLFDPRFTIVGEWRDPALLAELHRQDAVVDSLYAWVERGGYGVDVGWSHRATVDVGLAVRRTPVLGGVVAARIHPDADRDFLVTGLAFQVAGERLYGALDDGPRLEGVTAYDSILAEIEALREADLARWQQRPRRSVFHRSLHPERDLAVR